MYIVRLVAFGMFWAVVLLGDLRRRRVPIPVLLALMILSLIGQAWPWWLLAGGMLLWPSRRSAIMLAPIAIGIGVVTNSPAPAIAIAAGSAAWALGWWGGADSIALVALGLWHGIDMLVHPLVIGNGTPLFDSISLKVPLRLVDSKTYENGVVNLRYERI